MDMEAATADPSSNPFAPCKGTNVEVPSPDDHSAEDLMDYHHPNHHNGHSNNDIMTSSFYGNGGANGEDARHLFGDLGPETDVDLLDDDGVDACYTTDEKDMKITADKVEQYVTEDGLLGALDRKEVDHLGGGDFTSYAMDTNPLRDDQQQVHLNPFASDDWMRGGKVEVEGMDRFGMTQFEEPPSMRQHFREDDGVMMGEQVVACKEEIAVEKGEVVEEEELEIGGGSGVEEEAYDDSEEEAEWKYVAAKPVEGGAAVPEAVTPEATLPDEAPCSPALPEQEVIPTLSPGLPPRVDAVTPEEAYQGELPALPPRLDAVTPEVAERGISPSYSPRLDAVTPEAADRAISPEIPQRLDAVTPEVAERVVSPALSPRFDALTPEPVETGEYRTLSPAVPPRLQAATPETLEREDFGGKAEGSDIESAEEAADENKFCLDLGFEVVQKSHIEEAVTQELDLLKNSSEIEELEGGRQQQCVPQEVPIQEGEAAEVPIDDLEGSTMESRLNPDAAEFVPVSPTRIVAAEPFPTVGSEFDAFKKEASECPGELSEGIAAVSTPVAKDRKSLANNYFENDSIQAVDQEEDSDLVLSSSFSRDVPKSPQNLFEGVGSGVETSVTEPSDYVANINDDENKENIMQGEDKENVAQHSGTCDPYSVLNQSFEVLDERSIDSNQITDSVEAVPTSENAIISEMARVEPDVVADTVKESSEALNKYSEEFFQQHNEPTHDHVEDIQEMISGGVDVLKPVEPMDVFSMEGISQQTNVPDEIYKDEEIERSFMKQEALVSGLSPVPMSFETSEFNEKNQPLMQLETSPEHNIEDEIQFHMEPSQPDKQMELSNSPILEASSHVTEDFLEKHVDSEVIPEHDTILKDLVMEEKHATVLENVEQAKSPVPEVLTDSHVESSVERIQSFGVDFNTFTPESIVMDEQVVEYEESQKFVPPSSEIVSVVSPNVPVSTAEISALIEESHALSLEEKVPVVESPKLEQFKHLEVDELETTSGAPEVELGLDLVSQKSENEICTPSTENIMSPEPMEILSETKEATQDEIISPADAVCKESVTEVPPQPIAEVKIPEDANKTETVVAAVAAAAVVAGVGAVAATAASKSDSKPAAKKATPSDKKKMPDKSKVSAASTATTKAKPSPKPMTAAGRTSTTSKAPVTSPTKPLGTTAAKPLADRKTAAPPPAKSAATTKSAASAPLSSKPKTTTSKPTTAPTSRVGLASKTSAATSRPASATTATKSATTAATSSKSLSSAPRPSTAPSKATEVKKTMNGEASKPSPTSSTAPSRTAPRKPLATSSTATSRLTTTSTKPAPARGTSSTLKSATESLATKTKSSPVTSAVNGAPPKTSRLSTTTASRSPAAAPARTRAPLSSKTTTAAATGDPKKAKESANKHISAARPTGTIAAKKTAGSPATKSSVTSPATALKKGLANGTAGKKADANINSKKAVEEKVELVISHHENGIESECNDVRKELDGMVDVEEVVHEVKEQMVLIGDAIGVGEAV